MLPAIRQRMCAVAKSSYAQAVGAGFSLADWALQVWSPCHSLWHNLSVYSRRGRKVEATNPVSTPKEDYRRVRHPARPMIRFAMQRRFHCSHFDGGLEPLRFPPSPPFRYPSGEPRLVR